MVNQSFRIVVEVASIDENGIISQPFQAEGTVATNPSLDAFRNTFADHVFESTVRTTMPSGR